MIDKILFSLAMGKIIAMLEIMTRGVRDLADDKTIVFTLQYLVQVRAPL